MTNSVHPVPGSTSPPFFPPWRLLKYLPQGLHGRLAVARAIGEYGDVVRLPFPGKRIYFLSHPADAKRVLQENAARYTKSFDYGILARLLKQGLLTSEGEIWKRDRKLVQPHLREDSLPSLIPHMLRLTDRTLKQWPAEGVVQVFDDMMEIALDTIGQRTFNADLTGVAAQVREDLGFCQAYLIELTQAPVDWGRWFPTPGRRRFNQTSTRLWKVLDQQIAARRARNGEAGLAPDILGALDAAGIDEESIRGQVMTLFAAGHETTANGLGWTLHLLARHPDWQRRVAQECRQFLAQYGDSQDTRAYRDGLPLLTATLEESYRLYPPIPVVGREAQAEDQLRTFRIPKGATLVVSLYGLHRRPDLWENPDAFDPERFLGERRTKIAPHSFLPFGFGPRVCAGASMAMVESLAVLARLLARVEFQPLAPELPAAVPMASLRPFGERRLRVSLRH